MFWAIMDRYLAPLLHKRLTNRKIQNSINPNTYILLAKQLVQWVLAPPVLGCIHCPLLDTHFGYNHNTSSTLLYRKI